MLGKLIKDEVKSYRFSFGIMFLAGLVLTIFMKALCMLPYDPEIKESVQVMVGYSYYYIIMLISFAATILVVVRFCSTMVGDRGYLTWTLPASSSTHIWAKLIGGMLWRIIALVVTVLYLGIFVIGDYWTFSDELSADVMNEFGEVFSQLWKAEYLVTIFLAILVMLLASVAGLLLLYLCIAVGQLFGKWRIPASIGCYFVIIIIAEVITIANVFLIAVNVENNTIFERMSPVGTINMVFGIMAVGALAISAIMFAITNHIFKKRLNLE